MRKFFSCTFIPLVVSEINTEISFYIWCQKVARSHMLHLIRSLNNGFKCLNRFFAIPLFFLIYFLKFFRNKLKWIVLWDLKIFFDWALNTTSPFSSSVCRNGLPSFHGDEAKLCKINAKHISFHFYLPWTFHGMRVSFLCFKQSLNFVVILTVKTFNVSSKKIC